MIIWVDGWKLYLFEGRELKSVKVWWSWIFYLKNNDIYVFVGGIGVWGGGVVVFGLGGGGFFVVKVKMSIKLVRFVK